MIETNGNWLLEILQYCTSGFWVFVGCFILTFLIFQFILKMFAVLMIAFSDPAKFKAYENNTELCNTKESTGEEELK